MPELNTYRIGDWPFWLCRFFGLGRRQLTVVGTFAVSRVPRALSVSHGIAKVETDVSAVVTDNRNDDEALGGTSDRI